MRLDWPVSRKTEAMKLVLQLAVIAVVFSVFGILFYYGRRMLHGTHPTKFFAFFAILFTSGLDVGLIMFPLTEFPLYEADAAYGFTNPLAIEFGFWGFFIWLFYFLTTFYFCLLEPKLRLFEIPAIKAINNVIIITTCSFTGYLFLQYLPDYIEGISEFSRFLIVGLVLLAAVLSSTDVRYIKLLSLGSAGLFFALIAVMGLFGGVSFTGLGENLLQLADYFPNIHRFVVPFSDYHAFYLFWWFAWSIMIGQFVAKFVGGLRTWQLLLALLIVPSIPIAVWFSVLFAIYEQGSNVSTLLNACMIVVGIVFVINSLDSLTRLYTESLELTAPKLGLTRYVVGHWVLLFALILMYQFTPLQIEWIGLVVILLYCVIAVLIAKHRQRLAESPQTSTIEDQIAAQAASRG